ncbi:unnamed protein product [Aureobasidium vineae]|uniref:Uncharacterized protein n=1 Tax=Aureobasidium vineae TaxID=2773715 RepID=A0A9N8J8Y1_9PEZI|nr:unnamed protein product [Aureobasidium vineae]
MGQTPEHDDWISASALSGSQPFYSAHYDTIARVKCSEDYAKSARAERDLAERKCEEIQLVAIAEKEHLQKALEYANDERALAKEDLESMRFLRDQDKEDLESLRSSRDKILQDLSEAKAQLAAIESQKTDPASCQTCRYVVDENLRVLFKNEDLEAQLEQSARDTEKAQQSIAGGDNIFAVINKVIAKQKTEIAEHKAEIARLNTRVAELQVSQPLPDSTEEKERALEESIEHSEAAGHCMCDCPLVMRITVWVSGASGKDTEFALVKMDPDTSFKAVLKDLRRHHPLKALRQKSTGRWIFDSDTPTDVSILLSFRSPCLCADDLKLAMKDEEKLNFIQECGEPLYMLDATTDGAKCWRGKNSRI